MRAVAVDFESHRVALKELPEPPPPGPGEALFRIHQTGVCGTDREIAAIRLIYPPPGESFLTLGHEALGQIVETGPGVAELQGGDWVLPMVRRPCAGPCKACASGRADLCGTGEYRERGIVRMHGYFTDYAVDDCRYLVQVSEDTLDYAILIEPLSAVEKAIEVVRRAHNGYFASDPPRALILGAGTIGILAALALRERGFEVAICSREERDHPRARLVDLADVRYIGLDRLWPADIVIEATGSAEAILTGTRSLARNGVLIVLGAPNANLDFPFHDMIFKNQALIGSVNATPASFEQAAADLARFDRRVLRGMIHRAAFTDFEKTLTGPLGPHPKVVHMMA